MPYTKILSPGLSEVGAVEERPLSVGGDEGVDEEDIQLGERFLSAYGVIEKCLRRKWGAPAGKESFRHLVNVLSKEDAVIRRFKDDLCEYAELRNAIVHERTSPDYLIAVPRLETVLAIEEVAQTLANPPRVYPRFAKEVAILPPSAVVADLFNLMRRTDYTQFPVYNRNTYVGLITVGGIARWAAQVAMLDPKARIEDVLNSPVSDVLACEKANRAAFISKKATIYEAVDAFRSRPRDDKWGIAALLVTESGKQTGKLLGIITPSDVLRFEKGGERP
ncbi:MAG: CBS domain-containing protein [Bacillota bacterium]|jgi:CBS domain-containing protein